MSDFTFNLLTSTRRRAGTEILEDRTVPAFLAPVSYPVGVTGPVAVVTADFNNDGQLDIACARPRSSADSSVVVLLGNADGTFRPPLTCPTGPYPNSLAVGDFDRDGKLDLATANDYVTVHKGNGDGTFQAPSYISIGSSPTSVAVGDFNGDTLLDLGVTSNLYGSGYYGFANVLIGNGDGSFSAPHTTLLGDGFYTCAVAADLNGDGFDDFVAGNYGYEVKVLMGEGTGYLQGPSSFISGAGPASVAAGDVNGDTILDLVAANGGTGGNNIGVLLGDGLGNFNSAGNFGTDLYPNSVVLGDFTGDGQVDAATVNRGAYDVTVLRGHGDGTFSFERNTPVGNEPWGVAAGDFNQDGWLDAVTANYGGDDVSVLINDQSWTPVPPPTVNISDATITEGNAGTRWAAFTVSLSAAFSVPVTVFFNTADGTATAGGDYYTASGTLTFASRETSNTITVPVIGDQVAEADETFTVNLSAPTNAVLGDSQGLGTILDDDSPQLPALTISDVSVTEGNSGTANAVFTVSLSGASAAPVTVNYATADGSASAGSDYQAVSGTLTISAGQSNGTITVLVNGDLVAEPNEVFFVNLSSATNATIGDGQGVGTIVDDEPRISISDAAKREGNGKKTTMFVFTVTLSTAYDQAVTMSFRTADGTAQTSDNDYVAKSGTLTFAPGETTKTITIEVKGDNMREADEYFYLDLFGNSSNSLLVDSRGIGSILNDD